MKKAVASILSIVFCLSAFSACSSEKSIEYHVDLAMAQLGKPTADAYRDMGLPGDPEKANEVYCLYAKDGLDILGKQLGVVLVHIGTMDKGDKLTEMRTDSISYSNSLNGDYDYPFKLYSALCEAYGGPEPLSDDASSCKVPFSEATPDSLKTMNRDDYCIAFWKKDGNEIELHADGDDGGYVILEIKVPIESLNLPPLYADDGTRIHIR